MTAITGMIFDIRKFSLHDGPGIRTTVFFKGCPLACWWCHNPESQSAAPELMLWPGRCVRCGSCIEACPQTAIDRVDTTATARVGNLPAAVVTDFATDRQICLVCESCMDVCSAEARELVGRRMEVPEVMAAIERDRPFYDESRGGVTFSGGEPLAQRAFLLELLKACKALDLNTIVDTSGYAPWKAFESILPYSDLILYDLKLMDDTRHRHYTGVPNGLILHNLQALAAHGARVRVRVPVIPGINDDAENIEMMGAFLSGIDPIEQVDLLPYHPSGTGKYTRLGKPYLLPETPTPSDERMAEITSLLEEKYHLPVNIGG